MTANVPGLGTPLVNNPSVVFQIDPNASSEELAREIQVTKVSLIALEGDWAVQYSQEAFEILQIANDLVVVQNSMQELEKRINDLRQRKNKAEECANALPDSFKGLGYDIAALKNKAKCNDKDAKESMDSSQKLFNRDASTFASIFRSAHQHLTQMETELEEQTKELQTKQYSLVKLVMLISAKENILGVHLLDFNRKKIALETRRQTLQLLWQKRFTSVSDSPSSSNDSANSPMTPE